MNLFIEIIGILSTITILISMLFKTTTIRGSILMRSINIGGSILFVVYGILLPALSTALLNAALVIVNSYHLVLLVRNRDK